MKYALMMIANNLLSLALGSGAVYLAVNGAKEWGWFLFGALITSVTYKVTTKKEENPGD